MIKITGAMQLIFDGKNGLFEVNITQNEVGVNVRVTQMIVVAGVNIFVDVLGLVNKHVHTCIEQRADGSYDTYDAFDYIMLLARVAELAGL